MTIVAAIAYYALQFFILLMWIRLIVDFVRSARPGWRPASVLLVLFSVMYAITDPPVKLVRRVIKPVRFGAVSIDFAWTIVLIVAIVLSNVVALYGRI
jgi:YggT family protein